MTNLIIDTTADLEDDFVEKENIQVVPLYIILPDGKRIKIKTEKDVKEFYSNEKLVKLWKMGLLKTSQPSIKDFLEAIRKFEKEEEILIVTLSSKLSGTYNVANLAKRMTEKDGYKIRVFDSKHASYSISLMIKDVLKYGIENINPKDYGSFLAVEDIDYLFNSGRLNRVKYGFLKLTKLKPLLFLEEGELKKYKLTKDPEKEILTLRKNFVEYKILVTKEWSTEGYKLLNPILAVNTGPGIGICGKYEKS